MDLKISQLGEYPSAQGFYTIGVQDGETKKYNLGNLESKVNSVVNACGIEEFSETKSYQSGDFVSYNGLAYKFIQLHTPGTWNSNHVQETTAFNEILNLVEAEDKQKTTIIVTSDDENLNLSGKTVIANVEGETNQRTATTDSNGKAVISIPRDKTFTISLGDLSGYNKSAALTSSSLSTEATLLMRYYKDLQLTPKTINVTITTTGGNVSDFDNKELAYYIDDLKTFGTVTFTSGSASFTFQNLSENGYGGTVIFPNVTGYTPDGDSRTIQFTASDDTVTLNYTDQTGSYIPTTFIRSSGTQWIDTGYNFIVGTDIVEFEFDIPFTGTIWGVLSATWPNQICARDGYKFGGGTEPTNISLDNGKHKVKFDGIEKKVYIDDNYINNTISSFSNNGNIWLFGGNYTTSYLGSCKIYSYKHTRNNVLVRDFVPYQMTNGYGCLKDNVEGKFYYNQGTGNFTVS